MSVALTRCERDCNSAKRVRALRQTHPEARWRALEGALPPRYAGSAKRPLLRQRPQPCRDRKKLCHRIVNDLLGRLD